MGRALMRKIVWTDDLEKRLIEYADSGLGNVEIAEKLGTTRDAIKNRLRVLGYKRSHEQKSGIYRRVSVRNGSMPPHEPIDARERKFAKKFDEIEELRNLEYVSGYTKKDCVVLIKCKICGNEFTRHTCQIVREKTVFCPECKKRNKKPKPRRRTRLRRKECKQCGNSFMATCREVYCSHECYRKANLAQAKVRNKKLGIGKCVRRAKHYGVEYEYGITIDKLVERDGNRCWLCGGECDKSDTAYGSVGPTYPTIDHVVPLAKGGPHTWDNVKLAHFICNAAKSARTDSDEILEAVHACADHVGRHDERDALGSAESTGASAREVDRRRRREPLDGPDHEAIPRDHRRDLRIGGDAR